MKWVVVCILLVLFSAIIYCLWNAWKFARDVNKIQELRKYTTRYEFVFQLLPQVYFNFCFIYIIDKLCIQVTKISCAPTQRKMVSKLYKINLTMYIYLKWLFFVAELNIALVDRLLNKWFSNTKTLVNFT